MVNFYLFIYISQGSAWWLQQTAELQPWECQSCPEGTTDIIRGEGEQTHSGKGAKMLISPGSKILFVKKFNFPNQPLFLHVTQTNIQAFCWKGTWDFCWVQCRVCTELVTPCRFFCVTRFHNIPQWKFLFPSRWGGTRLSNTGWSVSSWKAQPVPVFEFSAPATPQVQKSPARCYTQVCTEQLPAGIPAGAQPAALISIQDNSAVCTKGTQAGQHLRGQWHFRADLVPNKVFQWWRWDIHLF